MDFGMKVNLRQTLFNCTSLTTGADFHSLTLRLTPFFHACYGVADYLEPSHHHHESLFTPDNVHLYTLNPRLFMPESSANHLQANHMSSPVTGLLNFGAEMATGCQGDEQAARIVRRSRQWEHSAASPVHQTV